MPAIPMPAITEMLISIYKHSMLLKGNVFQL